MIRHGSTRYALFGSLFVVGLGALVRLPHYDVAWFGFDSVYFLADARRALGGGTAQGPLASGLNIIGPLYSYVLAALLWLRDDPRILVLTTALWEVAGCWFVYDAARRVSSVGAGLAAAATYAFAPSLVFGTRVIWNPSFLPGVVALGWWCLIRYCQAPSTGRLAALALACGLTQPLHATGLFHAAAWIIAAFVAKPPSLRQIPVGLVVGLIPALPVLSRLLGAHSDLSVLGGRIVVGQLLPTLAGIGEVTLGFPNAFVDGPGSASTSVAILHIQLTVAVFGLLAGFVRRGTFLPVWLGAALACALHVAGALIYSGPLAWHYFLALIPTMCLCLAPAIDSAGRVRTPAAVGLSLLAAAHGWFLFTVDRAAIDSGVIRIQAHGLLVHAPPGPPMHALTLRRLEATGRALRDEMPDGSTALHSAHGVLGELWRETGGEYLPVSAAPQAGSRGFLPMGAGAAPVLPGARVVGDGLCVFDAAQTRWKAYSGTPPAGWERLEYDDAAWRSFDVPYRLVGSSLPGPAVTLAPWHAELAAVRGRFTASTSSNPRRVSILVHGSGGAQHWIAQAFVNGTPVLPLRSRVANSSFFRNEEWLFDVTGAIVEGENVLAVLLDGHSRLFDLDIFEVPCVDAEWYQ